jgi:hypothetical protein
LRDVLTKERLNPTFVPQLRDTRDILIASFAPGVFSPKEMAKLASREFAELGPSDHDVVVFLAPRLPAAARDEILLTFRARRQRAVLVDDLDVCRLVAPDGDAPHGFLGLLEIILEQLRWDDISPFRMHDGRNVALDMFVGRGELARAIATTNQYSLVFSGRKLGKSALLRYVELFYEGNELPSGNTLRVLSIVAAGGDREDWIVGQIVAGLRRLGFESTVDPALPDGDRLTALITEFLDARPRESLLVIVDEADQFVERQLEEYERTLESCLSFRMMKVLSKLEDASALARVRFVFAGYRVTNTNKGAWANAGDVLRLTPLTELESARLVQGPLARLGIDVADQAARIARRCGYQPAVLLKFGAALFDRVRHRAGASGGRVTVSAADVSATYDDEAVQREIRTVVHNNFQGNDVGAAVFDVLLGVFADHPPGASLERPADDVLERLRAVEADLSWLALENRSETQEIEQHLRDFVARGLIVEAEPFDGIPRYRLRFPHQLATLVGDDLPVSIRERIGKARGSSIREDRPAGLVPRRVLDDMTDMRTSIGRELGIRAIVVTGQWTRALEDDRAGVAARLGFHASEIARHSDDGSRIVVHGADPTIAVRALNTLDGKDIPLVVGGLDLARWAIEEASGQIATYGLGRLDERRIRWWFETRRALRFASPSAAADIARSSGGIPMLVDVVDRALECEDGADVDESRLERVLEVLADSYAGVAAQLASGLPSVRLTPREIELLILVSEAAEFGSRVRLVDDLGPEGLFAGTDGQRPEPFGTAPSDSVAVRILRLSGLLALDDDLMVTLSTSDPAVALGSALRSASTSVS